MINRLDVFTMGRFWLELEFNGTLYENDVDNIMSEIADNANNVDEDTLDSFGENIGYIIDKCTHYDYEQMMEQVALEKKQREVEHKLNDLNKDFE